MNKKIFLLLMLPCFFATIANAQKSYTIKFNPPNGSLYDVGMDMVSKVSQTVMGQDMEINMGVYANAAYSVKDETPNKHIAITYEAMKMTMDAMGHSMEMDSQDPDTTKQTSAIVRSMIGKPIEVTLSPYGKVLKLSGTDAIVNGMKGGAAEKEAMKNVMSDDVLKSSIEQSFRFYPEKPVKVGDSWDVSMKLDQGFPINGLCHYKLVKVEGNTAFLDLKGALKTDSTSKVTKMGMEMTADLTGDMTGTMEVNLDTGMPLVGNIKLTMAGNMDVMGQKVPMTSNTDTKINVKKK